MTCTLSYHMPVHHRQKKSTTLPQCQSDGAFCFQLSFLNCFIFFNLSSFDLFELRSNKITPVVRTYEQHSKVSCCYRCCCRCHCRCSCRCISAHRGLAVDRGCCSCWRDNLDDFWVIVQSGHCDHTSHARRHEHNEPDDDS